MPKELQELVGFIASPNAQIRALAIENLVPYSTADPAIFKCDLLAPIRNLKLLVRDHPKISEHAITCLVNLSADQAVLELLATDEVFLDALFSRLINREEQNADLMAMLLANLVKWDGLRSILRRKQSPPPELGSSDIVLDQLVDLFVKGQDRLYNKNADFDYLAYAFADLAKHAEVRNHILQPQAYDGVVPLSKIKVFTEHKSHIRREGVASVLKNVAFQVTEHPRLLSATDLDVLPYVLLPITGSEEYPVEETMAMLPDLQLLPPDKRRDPDPAVIRTHVETLTLLTSTRVGRDLMREVNVYPIIRETHATVDDDAVREACDRLVQVLMRDEEPDPGSRVEEVVDEEDQLVEV